MRTRKIAGFKFVVLALGALTGCGEDEAEAADPAQAMEQGREALAEATRAQPEAEQDPCEVLTVGDIEAVVALPEGATVEAQRGAGVAAKLCTFTWKDPNFDEQAHRQELMKKMQEAMRSGQTGQGLADLAMAARTGGEVSYTHMPASADAAAAQRQFEGAMKILNEGISSQVEEGAAKGQTIRFQSATVPVEGVGDAAQWSARMHQLSVLSGERIFHLGVRVATDEDRGAAEAADLELAKKLAQRLID